MVTTSGARMFYRRKREGYGQIIETFREDGKVKQRVILYVGHYGTIGDALFEMPKEVTYLRGQATRQERHAEMFQVHPSASEEVQEEYRKMREVADRKAQAVRQRADDLARRLDKLRELVTTNPSLRSDRTPFRSDQRSAS